MIRINNTQCVHFLEQADALRRSGLLCDAVISVRNQIFRAHRLVLACASRRLAEQLALPGDDGPVRCTLESFSPRTFKQVLDFTYARALEVTRDDLQLLLRAAEVLEMQLLEDECRKHLERARHLGGEAGERRGGRSGREPRGGPAPEEKPGGEEGDVVVVVEDVSPPSDPATAPGDGPRPPPEKAASPPSPAAPSDRVSVISRHAGSDASFPPPWTFPSTWKSVTALKRLADCSGFVPFRPLQHPDRSAVAYPFAGAPQHVLPLLGSHFQSSASAYSDLNSAYARGLYAGSAGIGSIIKQGLLKRKKSQRSYNDEPEAGTDPADEHHRCSKCPCDDPRLRNAPDESGGGRLAGSANAAQQQSQQQPQEHKVGKPHQCQHCPKKFSLKHQLDTHHRVHTGEKPFECRLCGQRSRDYSAMIKHLRTHNGASPYRCTVCLEFCSSLVAMQRHVKNHAVQDFPPGWSISSTYLYNSHN